MPLKGQRPAKYPKDIEKVCLFCGSVRVVRFHTARESVINYYCTPECKAAHWGKHQKTRDKLQHDGMSKAQANKPVVPTTKTTDRSVEGISREAEYWRAYRASRGLPRIKQEEVSA